MVFQNGKYRFRAPAPGAMFQTAIGGDVCPGEIGSGLAREGRASEVFAAFHELLSANSLNLVQWETPLAGTLAPIPKSGPNLNSAPESVEIIGSVPFQVALLANNHTGDHGPENLFETIRILRENGIKTVGAGGTPAEANAPLFLDYAGYRIAVLNYCEHEFGTVSSRCAGTAPLDPFDNPAAIRAAAKDADFVIVVTHGGHEFNSYPSPRIVRMLRAFVDAGASLVLNCHTHCPEGLEFYHGVPIVYSPGNLFFPGDIALRSATWRFGYLPIFRFDAKGVYELEVVPYTFDNEKVTLMDAAERDAFCQKLENLSAPLSQPEELDRLFDLWSREHGYAYLSGELMNLPENWEKHLDDPETARQLMGLRNLFTCEAHRDMIDRFLRQVEEGRTAECE